MRTKNYLFVMVFICTALFFLPANVYGQKKKNEDTIKIKTSAICGMCKTRIEKAMAFEKGVKDVSLDDKTKVLTLVYKPSKTNPETLRNAVTKIGYDADDKPADPVAYDKLPPCCKKGNEAH
ncbi:MAG: hypothetical protein A2275_09645 [Bacteroidetes bacterium RIFOXYA12_FULL_35_11]|nr:MAG: hypothetical protein A2X01_08615 [Bacteroidetes bacterium GWF2_35_48]OFY74816.1 MAG: hypothetical protein A2275_09645 [Bacteroidetes bacterium RIFOXYA12_FULL_35_11]OFY94943.1 MAG: hypothetical protein A2309_04005 [Bacteroidetes bacterium RIFOXYB2_FULL_35_7]OFY97942.1 MAG: hypothetical protein A2491_03625 [Bacteroidetes bacterium RIFOXYC12_FULL_35_7]